MVFMNCNYKPLKLVACFFYIITIITLIIVLFATCELKQIWNDIDNIENTLIEQMQIEIDSKGVQELQVNLEKLKETLSVKIIDYIYLISLFICLLFFDAAVICFENFINELLYVDEDLENTLAELKKQKKIKED